MNSDLTWYVIRENISDRKLAEVACSAIFDVLEPRANLAVIDAYTDFARVLTGEAIVAQDVLRALGGGRRGDPGMRIRIGSSDPSLWHAVHAYAPWSINVEIYGTPADSLIAVFHDCSADISFRLTADEVASLTDLIGSSLTIEPLAEFQIREGLTPRPPDKDRG